MKSSQRLLATALVTFSPISMALAEPLQNVIAKGSKQCFARTYSNAHMASHLGQIVRSMVFEVEWNKNEPGPQARIGASIRGASFTNWLFCPSSTSTGLLRCGVPCDGGSVEVGFGQDGEFYLHNNGVTLSGGCGAEAEDTTIFLPSDSEHSLFRLDSVPCL